MAFPDSALTTDGFLSGRLRLRQPRTGYRAATDPVLMAAAVPARRGESILELGCGAGVASLCLAARVPGVALTGLELQPDYAELARWNAMDNGVALRIVVGDLADLPAELRAESFDHVMANPPYYPARGGTAAADPGRETALREATPLAAWIDTAIRRLKPGGWLTVIQLAERLPDLLAGLDARMGSVRVLPLAARAGRPAGRIILHARKGGRAPFRLCAPLVLHAGPEHLADGEDYTPLVRAVLRDGAALDI